MRNLHKTLIVIVILECIIFYLVWHEILLQEALLHTIFFAYFFVLSVVLWWMYYTKQQKNHIFVRCMISAALISLFLVWMKYFLQDTSIGMHYGNVFFIVTIIVILIAINLQLPGKQMRVLVWSTVFSLFYAGMFFGLLYFESHVGFLLYVGDDQVIHDEKIKKDTLIFVVRSSAFNRSPIEGELVIVKKPVKTQSHIRRVLSVGPVHYLKNNNEDFFVYNDVRISDTSFHARLRQLYKNMRTYDMKDNNGVTTILTKEGIIAVSDVVDQYNNSVVVDYVIVKDVFGWPYALSYKTLQILSEDFVTIVMDKFMSDVDGINDNGDSAAVENVVVQTVQNTEDYQEDITDINENITDSDQESADIALINTYYQYITDGLLTSAREMMGEDIDQGVFNRRYSNVDYVLPYDFHLVKEQEYQFNVDYFEHNREDKIMYDVTMRVADEKLYIHNIIGMRDTVDLDDGWRASVQESNGTLTLFMMKGEKKILVEQYRTQSPNGFSIIQYDDFVIEHERYVSYRLIGWEYFARKVYDLKEEKHVLHLPVAQQYGFVFDDELYYACALNHLGGEMYVDVYDVSDNFNKVFDIQNIQDFPHDKFVDDLTCAYDTDKAQIQLRIHFCEKDEYCTEEEYTEKKWKIELEGLTFR